MRSSSLIPRSVFILSLAALAASSAFADHEKVNKANWKLSNQFTPEMLRPYVYSTTVTPGWIQKTDQFWYSWKDSDGIKFYRCDPKAKKKWPLFDSVKMAAQLSEAMKKPYDTTNLLITTITFPDKGNTIKFTVETTQFEYDLDKQTLKNLGPVKPGQGDQAGGPPQGGGGRGQGRGGGGGQRADFHNYSPDKKAYAYAMDNNLYVVEVGSDGKDGAPTQLTTDGVENYSFGSLDQQRRFQQQFQQGTGQAPPPSNEKRVRANVTWSKDSKKFYVVRQDERKVNDLFLVNTLAEPRPTLLTYKYAMPGEINVPQEELSIYDRDTKKFTKEDIEKWHDQRLMDIAWPEKADKSDKLRFVRRDRLQRNEELCELDCATGKVGSLFTESVVDANLEFQPIRYVKPDGDMIWWSERSGWGHFYLYSNDGKLKNAITSGPWRAENVVDVDADKGILYFTAVGREPGENPYYHHLYRVNLDGKNLVELDPENADTTANLSPSKKYLVCVCSRTDMEPKAEVRNDRGEKVMDLESCDLTRLYEAGWKMPSTFKVKAADGVTDIYGNMWKPFDFDANKKYPIIANVYPGPQTESVTSTFSATAGNQRLANLGFIVIQIGNRGGNPERSNAYQSFSYYNLRDYGLADKKAGIEQLAARFPWIDIDRVGIYGHSGGGFMTAAALLLPPYNDFFKVGVSSSGNHDNNIYNQNWSEQYHGLHYVAPPEDDGGDAAESLIDMVDPDAGLGDPQVDEAAMQQRQRRGQRGGGGAGQQGTQQQQGFLQGRSEEFQIKVPTTVELAPNLKGKLLIVTGDYDNNVHPANTIRLANALIKANKRFDFMLMPGKPHGYGDMQPYFNEMLYEYFCEHLLGDYYRSSADMTNKGR